MPGADDSLLPSEIHVVLDGTQTGPVPPETLRVYLAEGRIGPATLAWHPGLAEWAEIQSLPEFQPLLIVEELAAEPKLAGFGIRFAAAAIDTVLCSAILIVPAIALGFWPALIGADDDADFKLWFNLLGSAVAALYYVVPMSRLGGGATPGYRLFRLRLIEDGTAEGAEKGAPSVWRTLVWYIVTFAIAVGWLTYFVDSKRRMLHNLVSNTLVVVSPRPTRT